MRLPALRSLLLVPTALLAWTRFAQADVPPHPVEPAFSRHGWGWLAIAVVAFAFAAWIWSNHRKKVALERAEAAGDKAGADTP